MISDTACSSTNVVFGASGTSANSSIRSCASTIGNALNKMFFFPFQLRLSLPGSILNTIKSAGKKIHRSGQHFAHKIQEAMQHILIHSRLLTNDPQQLCQRTQYRSEPLMKTVLARRKY